MKRHELAENGEEATTRLPLSNIIPALKEIPGFGSSVTGLTGFSNLLASTPSWAQKIPSQFPGGIPGFPGIQLQDIPPEVIQHVLNGGTIPGVPQALLDTVVQGYRQKMALAASDVQAGKTVTSTNFPPLTSFPPAILWQTLPGKKPPGLGKTETTTVKNYNLSQITTEYVAKPATIPQLVSASELLRQLPRDFDLTVLPQSLLQQLASGQKLDLASIPKEVVEGIRRTSPDFVARLRGAYQPEQTSSEQKPTLTDFLKVLPPTISSIIPEETFHPYDLSSLDRQSEIGDPSMEKDNKAAIYTGIGLAAVGLGTACLILYLCYQRKLSSTRSSEELDRKTFFTSSPKNSFESTAVINGNRNQLSEYQQPFEGMGMAGDAFEPSGRSWTTNIYDRPSPSRGYNSVGLPEYRRTEMQTYQ